jgi:hypothetical protein
MKTVTRGLRKELGGVPEFETDAVVPISNLRAYQMRSLLAHRPAQSINIFADITGTETGSTVRDRVAGLFPVTVTHGTVNTIMTTGASNGADNPITALQGTVNRHYKAVVAYGQYTTDQYVLQCFAFRWRE